MTEPTWNELLAREPALGDLLAEVRKHRSADPDAWFWAPDGPAHRLWELLAAIGWYDPYPLLSDSNDTPRGVLWAALPQGRNDTTMVDRDSLPVAARADLANRQLLELAQAIHLKAERARAGAVYVTPSGQIVPAAYFDALARACAGMTLGGDEGIERAAQAIEEANAALEAQP